MSTFEIPLSPDPQTFNISLGTVEYQLTVQYRDATDGGWFLDIADDVGNPILNGIPLVTGANLLLQYEYLNFQGELRVQTDFDADAIPTFENLGERSHLYFITTP